MRTSRLAACLAFVAAWSSGALAADLRGQVTFSGLPVPGATVTATQGSAKHETVTDDDGGYRFPDLAEGTWTIEVAMLGFATAQQDVAVASGTPPASFALTITPFDQIAKGGAVRNEVAAPATPLPGQRTAAAGGFQRAAVTASPAASAPPVRADAPVIAGGDTGSDRSADAADGFLINGSVNNSASSPFAQLAAFGNNRRGGRSLYNGGIGVILDTSRWDSSPFSFTGQPTPKPVYTDAQVSGQFAGPVKLPGLRNKATLFLGYQHTSNHDATTQTALVPTAAERSGDFSLSVNALGQLVRPIDPATGSPFAGALIPQQRIAPQAASLLNLYPLPNVDGGGRYNFQTPVLATTVQDAMQLRMIAPVRPPKDQVFGTLSLQRTTIDTGNIFGFTDASATTGIDTPVTWSHRFSQFSTMRLRYEYTALITHATPFFSGRENISGEAGIAGNDQNPADWGPPGLTFSSGIAALTGGAPYASNHDQTHAAGGEVLWSHGRHNVTYGGDVKARALDVVSQQNARGAFTFTGSATGSDLGDFLLGLPHASSIAFGNAEKNLRATIADAYITDDWRISPSLTANVGARWEFESPFTEQSGSLVNLSLSPDFRSATTVVSGNPLKSDFRGIQPRIGVAWRPIAGSSLVVRSGYGIYRNTAVYQAMDLLLAQQPPLSTTLSIETSPARPLTLANGFPASPSNAIGTFAVDPNLRVGYAQNWQVLVQRDLPASLTMTATYLGAHGSHLLQEFLPNTYPAGAVNPCPACPAGFAYLTSSGTSDRNAVQLQLRRRLRNGLAASVQYTLAKATDDAAAAFAGASLGGASIAQDWLNPAADYAPSNFDQRHQVTANVQYTSGIGVSGGTLLDGIRGALFKGWTVTSQLTVGSGMPLTPIFLTTVPGTAVTGSIRASLTGVSTTDIASGTYANPAAYSAPAPGQWGSAGRNSIRGPSQFSLNAGAGRSFLFGDRLSLDWRIDATNILNRVTYSGVNAIVGSPQFGLPAQANVMRKLNSTLRLRF
ncbi:MAG TPA: carboxypeptidase regulatory-like domain-containing protein [Vicinamibacterales bacterium]|nr:carboxypeptidase regulatory-like domain-containing protein [Vicinamibacterales bacterium]